MKQFLNTKVLKLMVACFIFFIEIKAVQAQQPDVQFNYALNLNTSGLDIANAVAIDASGNTYVTGQVGAANVASGIPFNGTYDIYFAKYNTNGTRAWIKYIGGTGEDIGYDIAVDNSGNVYITGDFESTADFDPGSATANLTAQGLSDIFFAKYDNNGNYVWAKSIGSVNNDFGTKIKLDASNNVILTGYFGGTADFNPGSGSASLGVTSSSYDIFLAKYDNNGNYAWAKKMGGTGTDKVYGMAVSGSNIYVCGSFQNTVDFNPGTTTNNLVSAGAADIFFAKYDNSGNYVWAKSIGSTSDDVANGIVMDAQKNLYVTGTFRATTDFNPGSGTATVTNTSGSDNAFFAKYDSTGSYVWANALNSNSYSVSNAIAIDNSSNIYLTGYFTGTIDFNPSATGTASLTATSPDLFFAKYDNTGNYIWAKKIAGTSSSVQGEGIAVDAQGYISIVGRYGSQTDFNISPTATNNLANLGNYDAFVARYEQITVCVPTASTYTVSNCDSFYWSEKKKWYYTNNTTDTIKRTNAYGCDSVITLNLTIKPPSNYSSQITAYGNYAWRGTTYTASGKYTYSYSNTNGCASVDTLYLTIKPYGNCWKSVSAGYYHTVGILNDGTLWAWGFNSAGQLGDGTTTIRTSPVQIGTDNDWASVSCLGLQTFAIKKNGTLWGWGYNSYGQLGDGTTTQRTSPVMIGTDNNWAKIFAGLYHNFAIKTDGSLWAWGLNSTGQLGDGTTTNKTVPTLMSANNVWVNISCGFGQTLAIKNDGTLWAWGKNDYNQLGDGTSIQRNSPVQIGTSNNWLSVGTYYFHSAAIKTDGTLWSWGLNSIGQLGDGTINQRSSPVKTGSSGNWSALSVGYARTVATKNDGSLWAWGGNSFGGGLGDGSGNNSSTPIQLGNSFDWAVPSIGYFHNTALKTDGSLYTWGYNTEGELGDGTTNIKSIPTNIACPYACTPNTGTFTVTSCNSFIWPAKGNKVYTASNNTDTIVLTNAGGCDSVVTLNLTIIASSINTTTINACNSYTWANTGQTYTASGIYTGSTTNCVTEKLNLTINNATSSGSTITACNSYTWAANGQTYTASGTYTKTFTGGNSVGCDSTATLNLTINNSTTSTTTHSVCNSYVWNGQTYTTSGTYTKTFTAGNSKGCDSTATLNLTINQPTSSTANASVCSNQLPYSWNGLTFTGSGTQSKTFTGGNSKGCDSIATLVLTVTNNSAVGISIATSANNVCAGTSVTFTATPTNGGTAPNYQWKKNSNNVGTNSPIYTDATLLNNDTIWCILTSNSACISGSSTAVSAKIKMTIKALPSNFSIYQTNLLSCTIGATVNVTTNTWNTMWSSSDTTVATVTYPGTSGSNSGAVKSKANGTTTLNCTITGSNGCSITQNVVFKVDAVTPAIISGASSSCVGSTISLTANTVGGVWTSSSASQAPVSTSGVVTCNSASTPTISYKLTNSSNCSVTSTKGITINSKPAVPGLAYATGTVMASIRSGANFCNNRSFTLVGTPSGGSWNSTNTAVATVNNAGVVNTVGLGTANIIYTVTNAAGCTNSTSGLGTVVTCSPRGVSSQQSAVDSRQLSIYPNPSTGVFNIKVDKFKAGDKIVITDILGKVVIEQNINSQLITLGSQLSKGMYLVSVITEGRKETRKIMIND